MIGINLSITAVLMCLFIQDLRDRRVYWWLFPLLAILFISQRLLEGTIVSDLIEQGGYCLLFLLIQLLFISIYFSFKAKHWIWITGALMGWGDILLLACLCLEFSLMTYVLFYILSLIAILITWWFLRERMGGGDGQIPFAGLQALLVVLLLTSTWLLNFDLSSDGWIARLMP